VKPLDSQIDLRFAHWRCAQISQRASSARDDGWRRTRRFTSGYPLFATAAANKMGHSIDRAPYKLRLRSFCPDKRQLQLRQ
jgi:hypothetical protein